MNASFGVNDQDMRSSIGRVSDGMAEEAIELREPVDGGTARLLCEGGGDWGGDCEVRKDADEGGGAGGQGTDEGGAPISRKEDADRSVV